MGIMLFDQPGVFVTFEEQVEDIRKNLKTFNWYTDRPNEHLELIDFEKEWDDFKAKFGQQVKFTDLVSYLLYPKVFEQYYKHVQTYGDVSVIPTRIFSTA
jgi:pyruvate carboxylase